MNEMQRFFWRMDDEQRDDSVHGWPSQAEKASFGRKFLQMVMGLNPANDIEQAAIDFQFDILAAECAE